MKTLLWALALLMLMPMNYWAGRRPRAAIGTLILTASSLPAITLVAYTGFRLAYAIVNVDEVNRHFQQGDLTYFGADTAFAMSFLLGGAWILMAYSGFRLGRRDRRPD
jgi:hypothetical protein